jgi:hypothetical protein
MQPKGAVRNNPEYIQGDYKWYVQLHKFIDKKVIVIWKLKAHHLKSNTKAFFFFLHDCEWCEF